MAGIPFRRNERLMGIAVMVVPAALCPLLRYAFPLTTPRFEAERGIYRYQKGAWSAAPALRGGAWGVWVSGQGAVWTCPTRYGGMSRLDGDHWTRFGSEEYGGDAEWLRGGLAVSGGDVWGATDRGVAHFDGRKWSFDAAATKTNHPVSAVAGPGGVWVVDVEGNLSHFDGKQWAIESLKALHPPAEADDEEDPQPRLALTDGGLWLWWNGLWRKDGEAWREIKAPGVKMTSAWMLGHDAENVWLWLWDSHELVSMDAGGRVVARYRMSELGLTEFDRLDQVAAARGDIYVATSHGLMLRTAGAWRNLGTPAGTVAVKNVAIGPDATVWVVAEARPLSQIAGFVGPPLLAAMVGLAIIGLLITEWLRGIAENRLAADQILLAAAGPMPGVLDAAAGGIVIARHSRSLRWKLCGFLVGFPYVMFALSNGWWLLKWRWPAVPDAQLKAVIWAAIGLVCAVRIARAWRRYRRDSADEASGWRYRRAMWGPAKWIVYVAVVIFVGRAPLSWVDRIIPLGPLASLVKFALVLVVSSLLVSGREILSVLQVKREWHRGNYDAALRAIRRWSFGPPSAVLLEMEGLTYTMGNRPVEGEVCFRKALAIGLGTRKKTAGLLGCLGEVLRDQGRIEEARKVLQGSIEMGDNQVGSSRVDLAELLLAQGDEPARALQLVDEARRIAKGSVGAKVDPLRQATRAWALALLNRNQEAGEAIGQVLNAGKEKHAPLFAATRHNVARALIAMGDRMKAAEQLRAASEADPRGKYGAQARRQLQELTA